MLGIDVWVWVIEAGLVGILIGLLLLLRNIVGCTEDKPCIICKAELWR